MKWFRVHTSLLNSPKFQLLPAADKASLLNLWCLAALDPDGKLPSVQEIAFALRISGPEAEEMVERLKAARFLDQTETGLYPHDWAEHQYLLERSTSRVKRHREKLKQQCNSGETQTETPSETVHETVIETSANADETHAKRSQIQIQNRTESETLSAAETAAAVQLAQETFDLSDEDREAALFPPTSSPNTALTAHVETVLDQVARRIRQRHPAVRRCGLSEVKKHLLAIVRRAPSRTRIAVLDQIDRNHSAWCKTPDWRKDGGQFAKGLDNWLAPSKERWNEPPPADEATEDSRRPAVSSGKWDPATETFVKAEVAQ